MRIVSLLPSLTELVCALGRGVDLVGVTHECDFPPGVEALPHLTRSRIPSAASGATIDALVAEQGGQLYDLDVDRLEAVRPDLILTQAQCDVCAVNEVRVRDAAARLPGRPDVESVNPTTLGDVHAMFRRVGDLLDARPAAEALIARFEASEAEIARIGAGKERPRVVLLEWIDPPYRAGHWVPELIERAGGSEVLGRAGEASRRVAWEEIVAARPEVILVSPCGFDLARGESEMGAIAARRDWLNLPAVRAGRVVLIDGSAYFARPGPRLEASMQIAAAAIDPAGCSHLARGESWRFLPVLA